jgi:hypothetical protein
MDNDNLGKWESGGRSLLDTAGFGALRVTLLFGSAAVALAIIAVPLLHKAADKGFSSAQVRQRVDPVITGATARYQNRYRLRRSVLQDGVGEPCVIYANGTSRGDC